MAHDPNARIQALGHLAASLNGLTAPSDQLTLAMMLLEGVSNLRAQLPDGTEAPLPPEYIRIKDAAAEGAKAVRRTLDSGIVTVPGVVGATRPLPA